MSPCGRMFFLLETEVVEMGKKVVYQGTQYPLGPEEKILKMLRWKLVAYWNGISV